MTPNEIQARNKLTVQLMEANEKIAALEEDKFVYIQFFKYVETLVQKELHKSIVPALESDSFAKFFVEHCPDRPTAVADFFRRKAKRQIQAQKTQQKADKRKAQREADKAKMAETERLAEIGRQSESAKDQDQSTTRDSA